MHFLLDYTALLKEMCLKYNALISYFVLFYKNKWNEIKTFTFFPGLILEFVFFVHTRSAVVLTKQILLSVFTSPCLWNLVKSLLNKGKASTLYCQCSVWLLNLHCCKLLVCWRHDGDMILVTFIEDTFLWRHSLFLSHMWNQVLYSHWCEKVPNWF